MGLLLACIVPQRGLGGAGRRRAEAALRQSEQSFVRLATAGHEGSGTDGGAALLGRAVCPRYGGEREGFWDWSLLPDDVYVSPGAAGDIRLPPDTVFANRDDSLARFPVIPKPAAVQDSLAAHFAGRRRDRRGLRILRGDETRWLHVTGVAIRQ